MRIDIVECVDTRRAGHIVGGYIQREFLLQREPLFQRELLFQGRPILRIDRLGDLGCIRLSHAGGLTVRRADDVRFIQGSRYRSRPARCQPAVP